MTANQTADGNHTLTIRLVDEVNFYILAMVAPVDFPGDMIQQFRKIHRYVT